MEQSLPNSLRCALACLVSLIFSLVEGARYLSTANPTNFNVTKETVFKQAACMEYQLIVFLVSGFFLFNLDVISSTENSKKKFGK